MKLIEFHKFLSKFIKLLPLPLLKLSFKVIKNFHNELFPELFEPYIKDNGAIFKSKFPITPY